MATIGSVETAVYDILSGDATFTGLLPGGVFDEKEINRQLAPGAFDANGELQSCALVKTETINPTGPYTHSQFMTLLVIVYQGTDGASIEDALDRVYALLHDTDSITGVWEMVFSDEIRTTFDDALRAYFGTQRYAVTMNRAP